jgi:hypothetical protein
MRERARRGGGVVVAGFAVLGVSVAACGGTIPQAAIDARAAQHRLCEGKPPAERLACVQKMPLLREDEPRGGHCMGHVDGERWASEAAPSCLGLAFGGNRGPVGPPVPQQDSSCDAKTPEAGSADEVKKAKAACELRLSNIDKAGECLRSWEPGHDNVHGASLSCFITVEQFRQHTLDRIAQLDKLTPELERADAERTNASEENEKAIAAKVSAEGEEEVKNGRCSQRHVDIYRGAAARLAQIIGGMSGSGTYWSMEAHEMIVATPSGTAMKMRTVLGGETHLFATGVGDVKISMKDSKGYDINGASPYGLTVASFLGAKQIASRQLQLNAGDEASMTVVGKGCALVVLASKR